MQKLSKRDVSLNEADALSDMCAAEREVLLCYAAALEDCASNSFHAQLVQQFTEAALDMSAINEDGAMRCEQPVADKELMEKTIAFYERRRKEISRNSPET